MRKIVQNSEIKPCKRLQELWTDQSGATTAEYAFIIVAVIVAVLATVLLLEQQASTAFDLVGNAAGKFGIIN